MSRKGQKGHGVVSRHLREKTYQSLWCHTWNVGEKKKHTHTPEQVLKQIAGGVHKWMVGGAPGPFNGDVGHQDEIGEDWNLWEQIA